MRFLNLYIIKVIVSSLKVMLHRRTLVGYYICTYCMYVPEQNTLHGSMQFIIQVYIYIYSTLLYQIFLCYVRANEWEYHKVRASSDIYAKVLPRDKSNKSYALLCVLERVPGLLLCLSRRPEAFLIATTNIWQQSQLIGLAIHGRLARFYIHIGLHRFCVYL